MSSTKPPNENETPKERKPGLRNVQTTMLFRAVNPELFIKPNKPVMAFGLVAITLCVAYLGYLHATVENKNDLYEAVDSEGSSTTFHRIREYRPFRTRYYTHRDILEIGADIQQQQHEKKEAEIQERIEKMKAELWSQAEVYKEDAVDKALKEAAANHSALVRDLKQKLGEELREEVRKAKAEMKKYMEDEQKREVEAAEQRMAHRLQCALMECAQEKMQAVAEARKQEREAALKEAARQHSKHLEQLKEESMLAEELHRKSIDQLNKEKCREINIALSIAQKENQIEIEKQLKEAEALHLNELEKVVVKLKAAEKQVETLTQELEKMTDWKDSLETEIQATRQAFQKYIDATFPNLSSGQADFILPLRKAFQQDTPEEAEASDKEHKSTSIGSVRSRGMGKQNDKKVMLKNKFIPVH